MANCKECPYNGFKKVEYSGAIPADIMIVGEAPGHEEEAQGRPFVGKSGKVLSKAIKIAGIDKYSIFIANAAKCRVDNKNTKATNKALACCREDLIEAIKRVKPKIIVTLGNLAMKQLTKYGAGITKRRGELVKIKDDELDIPVFVTIHPSYALRGSQAGFPNMPLSKMNPREIMIFEDFISLKKIIENNFKKVEINTTGYVEIDNKDIEILSNKKVLAIDIETNGLGLGNNIDILSISFTYNSGESKVAVLRKEEVKKEYLDSINKILANPKIHKIVANRPFDENMWRRKFGIKWAGGIHDVLVMAHLVDENLPYYNLEYLASIYTPLKGIKEVSEGLRKTLDEASNETLINYNGVDTDATFRLYNVIAPKLKEDKKLEKYYIRFLKPVIDMFSEISYEGFAINREKVAKAKEKLKEMLDSLHNKAVSYLPTMLKLKHKDKGIKLTRSALIVDYLFNSNFGLKLKPKKLTEKTKEPSTDEGHLKEFSHIPFVKTLLEWKKVEKIYTTYIPQIENNINEDGKIYPNTLFINTVTGRTVVLNPTIQTIPQRSEYAKYIKELFEAPKGWKLCARDLAQSELRIIGWLANDKNILDALKKGIDLHTKTATIVNKCDISSITKDMRQKAKPVNFGFVYGMQAKSFVRYAKEEYGQIFTLAEAENVRTAFFSKPDGYYMLPVYHSRMIGIARKYGYVRSPLGRKRRLPAINSDDFMQRSDAERQAINFPVQSFSSDLALLGKWLFYQHIKKKNLLTHIKLLWFIHDAVMFLAREDYVDYAHKTLRTIYLKSVPTYIKNYWGFEISYPVESDGKVGQNWADMEEVE